MDLHGIYLFLGSVHSEPSMPYNYSRYHLGYGYRGKYQRYGRALKRGLNRFYSPNAKVATQTIKALVVPDQMHVKLKWYEPDIEVYNSSPGDPWTIFGVKGNSLDSIKSSGGGKPVGLNQWAQFYTRYYVSASKIKVTAWLHEPTGDAFWGCVVANPNTVISVSDAPEALDQLNAVNFGGSSQYGQEGVSTVRSYMTTASLFGNPYSSAETITSAVIGSSPSKLWWWEILARSGSIPADFNDVQVHLNVEVTYYVTFYQRKMIPES